MIDLVGGEILTAGQCFAKFGDGFTDELIGFHKRLGEDASVFLIGAGCELGAEVERRGLDIGLSAASLTGTTHRAALPLTLTLPLTLPALTLLTLPSALPLATSLLSTPLLSAGLLTLTGLTLTLPLLTLPLLTLSLLALSLLALSLLTLSLLTLSLLALSLLALSLLTLPGVHGLVGLLGGLLGGLLSGGGLLGLLLDRLHLTERVLHALHTLHLLAGLGLLSGLLSGLLLTPLLRCCLLLSGLLHGLGHLLSGLLELLGIRLCVGGGLHLVHRLLDRLLLLLIRALSVVELLHRLLCGLLQLLGGLLIALSGLLHEILHLLNLLLVHAHLLHLLGHLLLLLRVVRHLLQLIGHLLHLLGGLLLLVLIELVEVLSEIFDPLERVAEIPFGDIATCVVDGTLFGPHAQTIKGPTILLGLSELLILLNLIFHRLGERSRRTACSAIGGTGISDRLFEHACEFLPREFDLFLLGNFGRCQRKRGQRGLDVFLGLFDFHRFDRAKLLSLLDAKQVQARQPHRQRDREDRHCARGHE